MTEVCNCGGGHRTRLKINLCLLGCPPAPVYKGRRRGCRPAPRAHQKCGVLLGLQVLVGVHQKEEREKEGEGEEKERGGASPPPSPIRTRNMGGRAASPCASPLSPLQPTKAHMFPRIPVTPLVLRKIPESLEYMNLYVSTISRLLVISVISSETPNNLRSSN